MYRDQLQHLGNQPVHFLQLHHRLSGTVCQVFRSSQGVRCQLFHRKAPLVFFFGGKLFKFFQKHGEGVAHVKIGHECVNPIQQMSKISVKAQIVSVLVFCVCA